MNLVNDKKSSQSLYSARSSNLPVTLVWFRRDLRLYDHAALFYALKENENVLPIFIFDTDILSQLPKDDARVTFIYQTVMQLKEELKLKKSDMMVLHGQPEDVFKKVSTKLNLKAIYTNHDYEPSAVRRDEKISQWCKEQGVVFKTYKDQTIFEKNEVLTDARKSYTVYTPYKKKWLSLVNEFYLKPYPVDLYEHHYINQLSLNKLDLSQELQKIQLKDIGFIKSSIFFPDQTVSVSTLKNYAQKRDFPYLDKATSLLGLHLRFGTVSIRELAREGKKYSEVWLSELIWRDFFMQILWHYPHVVDHSFRREYDRISWRNDDDEIELWKSGQTGYPLVDAGMRELNATGHMHNRVRMVVASFLTKHLLHHWSVGERYFAEKLLDYDLSANNGNWQWAAGTGCDAAPYFRVFNPQTQLEKFDPDLKYVKTWVPEYGTSRYCRPMVDHQFARDRALKEYKLGLGKS